jgi:hypothetical protein
MNFQLSYSANILLLLKLVILFLNLKNFYLLNPAIYRFFSHADLYTILRDTPSL